jgi:site-specific DNA-cytosine methylase
MDVLIAGTPCQSFSVTGLRAGLDDPRGQLALELFRVAALCRPRWVVWENVAGVLSANGGRAFGSLLGGLAECGYGFAYRVLDAQHYGVPQARRRVFVVGRAGGDWRGPAAVLFDHPTALEDGRPARPQRQGPAGGPGAPVLWGFTGDETPKFRRGLVPTLRAGQGGEGVGVIDPTRPPETAAWKLTADDMEALQGFPPRYTQIDAGTEGERRRALGNTFAVPVVRWIGRRIQLYEEVCDAGIGGAD